MSGGGVKREREREEKREKERERERKGERESQAGSAEPSVGLELTKPQDNDLSQN